MEKTKDLITTLELRREQAFWADLRLINKGERPILIHNPGHYQPTEPWGFTREAYDVAVLQSFHFLKMKLSREDGTVVEPRNVATRANHDVELPLELKPGAELKISIPLDEFYDLKSGIRYSIELSYGDDELRVSAKSQFQYP